MLKWFSRLLIGLTSALFVFSSTVFAATPTPAPSGNNSGQGLEISPPVLEFSGDPGQVLTATIRVRNVTQGQLIVKGEANDFGAGANEDGQPQIITDNSATRYSLKYWVADVPDLLLAPQELKTTNIKISIPKNAEPGGHFGVIRFTGVPPNLQGTGVALSASVGTLVLLKVSGQITDKLTLTEFRAVNSKGAPANFFEYGPINFVTRIKNEGSVHEKVSGTIVVTDIFGKTVGTLVVNETGGNILPDSTRKFENQLAKKNLFGIYNAKLALTYTGNNTLSSKISFWVIPWKAVLLVILVLIILFFVLRFALRKYNAHVIAQARKR